MPPFAVEVHPLAVDEVESGTVVPNATKLRQRALSIPIMQLARSMF